jgi:hypothetical protein
LKNTKLPKEKPEKKEKRDRAQLSRPPKRPAELSKALTKKKNKKLISDSDVLVF